MTVQPWDIYPCTGPDAPHPRPLPPSDESRPEAEEIAGLAKMQWARHSAAGKITLGHEFDGVYVPLVVVSLKGGGARKAEISEAADRLSRVPIRADSLSRDVERIETAAKTLGKLGDVSIARALTAVAVKLAAWVDPSQVELFDICAAGRHPRRTKTEILEAFVEMVLGRRRKTWAGRARSAAVPYPDSWAEDRLGGVLLELFNRGQQETETTEVAA